MRSLLKKFYSFYPYYNQQHSHPLNILFHFAGATLFFSFAISFLIFLNIWLLITGVFLGYLLPHLGHRYFQGNHSMRTEFPLLCVMGAAKLYFDTWKRILTKKAGKQKFST